MTRLFACSLALGFCLTIANAASELPKDDADNDSFEVEPPLLIPNRDTEPLSVTTPAPMVDAEKIEKDIERARKAAAGAERLFKIGVLAKVDVEKRALRVVRLQCDLQNARLSQAKENAIAQERRFVAGEITKAELTEIEAAVERATEVAQSATADRERAELAAAEVNLQRQQKLLALGSGHKSDVARAAERLAELKSPRNN